MKLIEPIKARVVNIPVDEPEETPMKGMSRIEKVVAHLLAGGLIFAVIKLMESLFGG